MELAKKQDAEAGGRIPSLHRSFLDQCLAIKGRARS